MHRARTLAYQERTCVLQLGENEAKATIMSGQPLDEDRPRLAWRLHCAIHPSNRCRNGPLDGRTPRNPAQQSNPKVRFQLQVHARMGTALEESGWMQLAEQPTWTLTPPAPEHMLCKRFME